MLGSDAEHVSETALLNPFCGLTVTVPITESPLLTESSADGASNQNPGVVFRVTPIALEVSCPTASASLSELRSAVTEPRKEPLTFPGSAENVPFPRPP